MNRGTFLRAYENGNYIKGTVRSFENLSETWLKKRLTLFFKKMNEKWASFFSQNTLQWLYLAKESALVYNVYSQFLDLHLQLEKTRWKNWQAHFQKIFILGKKPKNSFKIIFLAFAKNLIHLCIFTPKMVLSSVFYKSASAACLEKSGSSVMTNDALNQLDRSILWSSLSLEGINLYLRFFAWR